MKLLSIIISIYRFKFIIVVIIKKKQDQISSKIVRYLQNNKKWSIFLTVIILYFYTFSNNMLCTYLACTYECICLLSMSGIIQVVRQVLDTLCQNLLIIIYKYLQSFFPFSDLMSYYYNETDITHLNFIIAFRISLNFDFLLPIISL